MRFVITLFCALVLQVSAFADPHPLGTRNHKFNGSAQPVTENGVTTFVIRNKECSNVRYGDGRGESDCYNGGVRSNLSAISRQIGGSYTYSFEVRVDPLRYRGWLNPHSAGFLTNNHDSRLRIASWEGNRIKNFFYMLKLDSRRGITFLNETCADREQMNDWIQFKMEVSWRNDTRGWIRVSCNERIVHFLENVKTTDNPHCYLTNDCIAGVVKKPSRALFVVGPVMGGFGYEWKKYNKPSQFTEFNGEIRVQMRNLSVTKGATLYDEAAKANVAALQEHLTKLGCNPGPVDGVMGGKTRRAAKDCRKMPDGVAPEEVNAATLATWLAAYQEHAPIQ